jgi:epoxyqueuosine reductase
MYESSDTAWIITQAKEIGFELCGIAPAGELSDGIALKQWLEMGYAGEMKYLHDERRTDVLRVLPQAKSIIVCALNYNTAHPLSTEAVARAGDSDPRAWISRYAWGDEYHGVVGGKLEQLLAAMRRHFGSAFEARAYVDTGPVSERLAAQKAGLGWQGKNTCLINETLGSWLFLGVILTSIELAASCTGNDGPPADLCGNCRLCIDACPTGALVDEYVMDARRCISYLTIELRGSISEELRSAVGWQVFGCDICQDVCPWNRNAPVSSLASFQPRDNLFTPKLHWLLSLSQEEFRREFSDSPVRRTKWRGLIRNACVAAGNSAAGYPENSAEREFIRQRLAELAQSADASIAAHAAWALRQFNRE